MILFNWIVFKMTTEDPLSAGCPDSITIINKITNEDGVIPIVALRIITSSLSMVATAIIVFIGFCGGKLTNSQVHPIFMISLADFLQSFLWFLGAIILITTPESFLICYFSGIFTIATQVCGFFLTATYAIIAYLSVREVYSNQGTQLPRQDQRKRLRHVLTVLLYIISWVVPLVGLPLGVGLVTFKVQDNITNNCCPHCLPDFANLRVGFYHKNISSCNAYFKDSFHKLEYTFDKSLATAFNVSFITSLIAMIVFYVLFIRMSVKLFKIYDSLEIDEENKTDVKIIIARITCIFIVYILSAVPSFAASILVWNEENAIHINERPDRGVLIWEAIFVPLQGFLNTLIYGYTRRTFYKKIFPSLFKGQLQRITQVRYGTMDRDQCSGPLLIDN